MPPYIPCRWQNTAIRLRRPDQESIRRRNILYSSISLASPPHKRPRRFCEKKEEDPLQVPHLVEHIIQIVVQFPCHIHCHLPLAACVAPNLGLSHFMSALVLHSCEAEVHGADDRVADRYGRNANNHVQNNNNIHQNTS